MRTDAIEVLAPAGQHRRLPLFPDGADLTFTADNYSWGNTQRLPNLNYPLTYDPFCAVMRNISLNLREFDYTGTVDPALFWRADDEDAEETPLPRWEFLERIQILMPLNMPSGQWLCRGDASRPSDEPLPHDEPSHWPPGYSHPSENDKALTYMGEQPSGPLYSREDTYRRPRLFPNTPVFDPLLTAFARAIGAMPKLKVAGSLSRTTSSTKSPSHMPPITKRR